jgi:hypothetical protein
MNFSILHSNFPLLLADVCLIIDNLHLRKAPGFDLITAEVLGYLPRKAIVILSYFSNSILRSTNFPIYAKENKPLTEPLFYTGKISLNVFFLALIPIPHHQCGFRAYNFTVQQCLRIF